MQGPMVVNRDGARRVRQWLKARTGPAERPSGRHRSARALRRERTHAPMLLPHQREIVARLKRDAVAAVVREVAAETGMT